MDSQPRAICRATVNNNVLSRNRPGSKTRVKMLLLPDSRWLYARVKRPLAILSPASRFTGAVRAGRFQRGTHACTTRTGHALRPSRFQSSISPISSRSPVCDLNTALRVPGSLRTKRANSTREIYDRFRTGFGVSLRIDEWPRHVATRYIYKAEGCIFFGIVRSPRVKYRFPTDAARRTARPRDALKSSL